MRKEDSLRQLQLLRCAIRSMQRRTGKSYGEVHGYLKKRLRIELEIEKNKRLLEELDSSC